MLSTDVPAPHPPARCLATGDHVGMSERSLRQSVQAIIGAVAAADKDALDHLIAEDIVDHNQVAQPSG
ncbi:hypothetical protein, partial [Pseudomonas tremae]|uniref:hypothetical protein n=1 Tax=Pseudomonas tremae TaxID=200454 RepID=UPI00210A2575